MLALITVILPFILPCYPAFTSTVTLPWPKVSLPLPLLSLPTSCLGPSLPRL